MSVDLVLSCDHCAEDYARILNLPLSDILALAEANGWERRTLDGHTLDLCGGCKQLPERTLVSAHTDGPF